MKKEKGFREEQHLLAIIDKVKRQDNDVFNHNLTNKFQPLDLIVNQAAKALIQNQYNDWFSKQVAHQLKSGKDQLISRYYLTCQLGLLDC